MTLYQRYRLAMGLKWRSNKPPVPFKEIGLIALIIVAYGLVGAIDYHTEKMMELESAQTLAQVTLNCMNGAQGYGWKDANLAFECGKELK